MWFVFLVSIVVNIGMWFERFVIVVTSLHRDFLPSSWSYFKPTWVDICTYLGTFGLFFTFFLLFMRYLPVIAIAEGGVLDTLTNDTAVLYKNQNIEGLKQAIVEFENRERDFEIRLLKHQADKFSKQRFRERTEHSIQSFLNKTYSA